MMMRSIVAGVALVALAACTAADGNSAAPAASALKATPAPAGTEWATVVATPEGGYRMGNPDAPIKLIEYGSLTCPACAAFAQQAIEPLKAKYVATGKVSFEFRSFLLHGPDLMATMVMQCGGPGPFFTLLEAAYADQQNWLGKLSSMTPADQQRMQGLPIAAQNTALAQMSGLDQFAIQRGVSGDSVKQCLADPAMPDKLLKVRDTATTEFNLAGTPTFVINGKTVPNVASWADLEPQLLAAGA
jgi:protein-disulfide isomerase